MTAGLGEGKSTLKVGPEIPVGVDIPVCDNPISVRASTVVTI
jgi:hypothetical protein